MGEEELPLGTHGSVDVLLAIDVLLAPVHHTDVTWTPHSQSGILRHTFYGEVPDPAHFIALWNL